jgi:hypothetical protein
MKKYIFLSNEGITYQPNSSSSESDCENIQVIGIDEGVDAQEAFDNLIRNNEYFKKTNFKSIYCYQLDNNYEDTMKFFNI